MRPLLSQDHYELLEVARGASVEEIERAYRTACKTYAEGSMAGLSVFDEGDVAMIRERLDVAYRTLGDEAARGDYDAQLEAGSAGAAEVVEPDAAAPPLETLEDLDDVAGEFDGARLRRLRLHRGIELQEIAKTTKINPTYLQFLEEERFADLPAAVYVRGFVIGYASCVGLDPPRVAESYMRRYEESRDNPKRRRFARR